MGEPFLKIGVGKLTKGHRPDTVPGRMVCQDASRVLLVFDDNDTIVV